ncbi:hypothetical protein KBY97_07780 [Synechococcus sp. ATX 2A4]|nr:hypothetical protein [Synechococcus sp. ATX 2A4]
MAAAAELSWDAALAWIDDRAEYFKARIVALDPIGDILFFLALLDHEPARRTIGLRRSNRRGVSVSIRDCLRLQCVTHSPLPPLASWRSRGKGSRFSLVPRLPCSRGSSRAARPSTRTCGPAPVRP